MSGDVTSRADHALARNDRWRSLRVSISRDLFGWIGLVVLALAVLAALLAPWIAPHNPVEQSVVDRFLPPAWVDGGEAEFLFGTDHLGRDVLTRTLYAGRVSLSIGLVTAICAALIGVTLGIIAGFREGLVGTVVMRLVDIQTAFPFLVIAIAVVAVVGPSVPTLIATLTFWTWVPFARVAQGSVLKIKHQEYIAAARMAGTSTGKILLRHVLPNALPPLLVIWTFAIAQVIVAESALSFLGLGIQPPTPTWGSMVSQGRQHLDIAWWAATVPALAIVAVVLAVNLVGDWLRDRFDPQLST
ncbi:MAG: ABC transporter permease subunit [Propionibacteriales bacterium]|nr:ABC transporter permease subunit [Propionibacteriales bacterium]